MAVQAVVYPPVARAKNGYRKLFSDKDFDKEPAGQPRGWPARQGWREVGATTRWPPQRQKDGFFICQSVANPVAIQFFSICQLDLSI